MMRNCRDIQYTVHRKGDGKTASIYIERDGLVSIYASESFDDDAIDKAIESKLPWIHSRLAEWRELNAQKRTREYVNGESFLYLGRNYRLRIVADQSRPLLLKGGYFLLNEQALSKDPRNTFKKFYREKGQKLLCKRIGLYRDAMGVEVGKVRVMELRYRWASCGKNGSLNFHWKTMMAPLKVIDYIVVHEMAHLKHPGHNESFWEEVEKVLLDYNDRKRWLRLNGSSLDL